MFHNMLSVSRFAHYLKHIGRDLIGSNQEVDDIESELGRWISGFVLNQASASVSEKSQFPLFDADVKIVPVRGKSGVYRAVFDLQPHFEVEDATAKIRLMTEL